MSVTDALMNEHQLILRYLELMERTVNHSDSTLLFAKAPLFIEFIQQFADEFHHAKEEQNLFQYLAIPGVLTHCNPIPQMLYEHDKARQYVQQINSTLSDHHGGQLAAAIMQYVRLLREHIFKEDNILYPMAERDLSEQLKTELLADYQATEQRLNGQAIWQRYQTLYEELAQELS